MAIIVNIYYYGKNGSARSFAEEMEETGIADAVRQEPGNLRYEYFFPMSDPETLMLIDAWENQQALDLHHATPMMDKIACLREKYGLTMRVERYLPDAQGPTENDKKFIRG